MPSPPIALLWAAAYTLRMSQKAMLRKALGEPDEMVRDMTKQWAVGLCERMKIEVVAHGLDKVDWDRPCAIMANHQSYLDVLALYRALPHIFGFVAKKQLFSVPFFGGVMRGVRCVPVDRSKRVEAMSAMREAAEHVAAGTTITVFPEGTRSKATASSRSRRARFTSCSSRASPPCPSASGARPR